MLFQKISMSQAGRKLTQPEAAFSAIQNPLYHCAQK